MFTLLVLMYDGVIVKLVGYDIIKVANLIIYTDFT